MSARAYAELRRLGPIVTTAEAAAALGVSTSSASHTLRVLQRHGLVTSVRRGLWSLDTTIRDARSLAMSVTRPYPSYVSFESAFFAHGMIDQVPRVITLASLGRPRTARTAVATFLIHRLPPELFGGFTTDGDVRLASPEKALFDFHYVAEASGHPKRRPPELELPARFSRREIRRWIDRIADLRLRRRVARKLAGTTGLATLLSPRLVRLDERNVSAWTQRSSLARNAEVAAHVAPGAARRRTRLTIRARRPQA